MSCSSADVTAPVPVEDADRHHTDLASGNGAEQDTSFISAQPAAGRKAELRMHLVCMTPREEVPSMMLCSVGHQLVTFCSL